MAGEDEGGTVEVWEAACAALAALPRLARLSLDVPVWAQEAAVPPLLELRHLTHLTLRARGGVLTEALLSISPLGNLEFFVAGEATVASEAYAALWLATQLTQLACVAFDSMPLQDVELVSLPELLDLSLKWRVPASELHREVFGGREMPAGLLSALLSPGAMPRLQRLSMSGLNLARPDESGALLMLAQLEQLTFLSLSHSGLQCCPPAVLGLASLRELRLESNHIAELPVAPAGSWPHLTLLDLKSNRIKSLDMYSLVGATALRAVHVGENRVEGLLGGRGWPRRLTRLHLGSNRLQQLPLAVFQGVTALRHLDVGMNEGMQLFAGGGAWPPQLSLLELSSDALPQLLARADVLELAVALLRVVVRGVVRDAEVVASLLKCLPRACVLQLGQPRARDLELVAAAGGSEQRLKFGAWYAYQLRMGRSLSFLLERR